MKIAAGQSASAVRRTADFVGILIHGNDDGRVRELASAAVAGVLGRTADPFQLTVLAKEDHGRLQLASESRTLGGGRSVVHVRDAGDGLVAVLDRLKLRSDDVLIVLESAALPTRSKLRAFAERQADWGAIAVFAGSDAVVSGEIKAQLAQSGLAITAEALAYLTGELGADTATRRSEVEKLASYAHGMATVDLATAQECCTASIDATLSELVGAALAGDDRLVDALLQVLGRTGFTGAGLLAVFSGQVLRLLRLRLALDAGESFQHAVRSVVPPLYPREVAAMQSTLARWPLGQLEALGRAIHDADVACKRAGSPDEALAGRLLTLVASRATRAVRG